MVFIASFSLKDLARLWSGWLKIVTDQATKQKLLRKNKETANLLLDKVRFIIRKKNYLIQLYMYISPACLIFQFHLLRLAKSSRWKGKGGAGRVGTKGKLQFKWYEFYF